MCGIAGYFGTRPVATERVDRCLALMGRRGPDARGRYDARTPEGRHLLLLHTRLAIVDLDHRADQPYRHRSLVLTYNGEIYNHRDLRDALPNEREPFQTRSDTEVLIRQLAAYGRRGLDACEGMWAFALFDEAKGALLLARDRFGEKPLFLLRRPDGLYFGSEIKYLAALSGERLDPDPAHLRRYLVNGYKSLYKRPGVTFFRDVEELPPATVMNVDAEGRITSERYWAPARNPTPAPWSFDEATAAVRTALIRAVELRLQADVPLAFCLSGGVDSNAIIAIAKRVFGYDVHGFTLMNTDSRYEEREMVEHSVRTLNLRHTAVPIRADDFLDRLRALIRRHDAPICTITYYVQWQLMEQVSAAGYKVSISGTGADELFSGYFDHHNAYLAAVHQDPERFPAALAEWRRAVAPCVRNPFLQNPALFIERPWERGHIYLHSDEFAAYLTEPWQEPFFEENYASELLRNRMLNELFHEAVPPILHEDDLNAMSFSIENRSPYLDRSLFEIAQRIPTRHLVRDGRAKAVLRAAVADLAPPAVIDNPRKVGFNAPIEALLDLADPVVQATLLEDSPIFQLVRRDRFAALLKHQSLPNSASKFLFNVVNAKLFLEEFGG